MNLLTRVKSVNRYNHVVDNLYKEVIDEETGEVIYVPITDIEGDTALLTTDGSSWQISDEEWVRIEQDLDARILQSIYPFISSVCQSIHNGFIKYPTFKRLENVILNYKDEEKTRIVINNIETELNLIPDDFVMVYKYENNYLTRVINNEDGTLELDNMGVDIRVSGKEEVVGFCLVSFPQSFIHTVLDMLGYDFFVRDSKEKRQERLGNYTYTNFEPIVYNSENAYPKQMIDSIKYWQRIYV